MRKRPRSTEDSASRSGNQHRIPGTWPGVNGRFSLLEDVQKILRSDLDSYAAKTERLK